MIEIKKVGSLIPHKGHTAFQLKIDTMEMSLAEVVDKKILTQPGYVYCTALNFKNADKHFTKMLNTHEAKYNDKVSDPVHADGLLPEPGTE